MTGRLSLDSVLLNLSEAQIVGENVLQCPKLTAER